MTDNLGDVIDQDRPSPLAALAAAGQGLWNWGGLAGLPSLRELITGATNQPPLTINAQNAPQLPPDAPDPIRPSPVTTQMTPYYQGKPGTQSGQAVPDPNALPPIKPGTPLSANTAGFPGFPGAQSGSATRPAYGQPDRPYPPFQGKLPDPKPKTLPPPSPQGNPAVASKPGEPGAKPIDSSDWGKPDEQTQAVNKALDIIANMKVPTLDKLQDLPRPPTRETQNSWMSTVLSSAGLFLAMMGSRRSAAPMTAALKSFGGYLQGYNEGQQIVWKQKETEYQDQLNYAIKQNELELEQYKANLEANKDKLDMLHESLYATSLLNEDKKIQMELENGHIEIALKMMQARNEALKQVREQALNVIYGKIYAGLPVTEKDIAALTAEPDMGSLTTGSSERPTPNNVGNLRAKGGGPGWQTFDTPQNGAAAMINLLRSYGPMTVGAAINKYAPPSENPGYLQRVTSALKIDPNAPMPIDDPNAMAHIAYVMATIGEGNHVQPELFSEGAKIAYQPGSVDGKPQELDGKPQQVDGKPQATSDTGIGGTDQPARVGTMTQSQIDDAATTYLERGELPNLGGGGDKMLSALNFQTRQAILKRADDLSAGATRIAQDKDLTPDEKMAWVQKNIPRMAPIVQGLIDGSIDMPASRTMSTPFWDNAFSLAKAVDPTFSKSLYPQRRATVLAFSGSGQIRRGLNSASNMIKLADLTMNNIKNAGLSRYQALNQLSSFWKTQTGQATLTSLRQNFTDLADEAVRVVRASGGTEHDIERILSAVDPEKASPEQLVTAIQNIVRTAWFNVEDWQNQYQTDVGKPFDLTRALGKSVIDAHDRVLSVDPAAASAPPAKSSLPNVRWNPLKQRFE